MKKFLSLLLVALLVCSMFAACGGETTPEVTYDLEGAAAYVEGLYKDELSVTAVDFTVVSQVMIGGVTYQIDWAVDSDKVTVAEPENNGVVIGVDEKSPEEVSYKLTATIKAGDGTSTTVTFKLSVPKYEVNSHADYMAAQKGDILTVEGVVVAINSKALGNKYNHLFIADETVTGGYYCYSVTEDPADLGIKVGMTVKVTGPMEPYSGMQEIKGGQVAVLDTTIKEVSVVDITEAFIAGSDLGAYVGLPVVIKGVELGAQALEKDTDQYLWFAIGEKQGYVRTYVTDFPAGMLTADDKTAIDEDHAAHFGFKADVTGILILYNGAPYLIPMSTTPFTNYEEVVKTPAEKVAAELGDLKLDASVSADTVIDLLLKGKYYDDVTLAWATDDATGAAAIADGKLTVVVPDKEVTVNVTVTATCGDVSQTKTFTIKLSKSITSIKDLLVLGAAQESYTAEKYIAGGVIVEIQNDVYGNIVIQDESGESILVYGTFIGGKKYGEAESKPVVGDYVIVVGVVGQYKGTAQMKNADITVFHTPASVKDANDAGAAQDHNTYTEAMYLVTGVVSEIANDKYGNIYVKDAEGNTLYIYGLYDQTGARFDGMAVKPAVGDTVTVLGAAGRYNETVQLKNATLVCLVATVADEPAEPETPDEPAGPVEVTIAEAVALEDGVEVVVSGTVAEINTEWNDQYGNITVTITDGANTLYVYRLATNVKVGDVVTITGKVGSYNGSKQIAAGATAVITDAAPVEVSLTEAVALEDGVKVIVKGTVKEINTEWSEQYGNITVTIEDAEGNTLYIYRLATNVKVGDVVTITGKVGSYNGSKQIAAGATAVVAE